MTGKREAGRSPKEQKKTRNQRQNFNLQYYLNLFRETRTSNAVFDKTVHFHRPEGKNKPFCSSSVIPGLRCCGYGNSICTMYG